MFTAYLFVSHQISFFILLKIIYPAIYITYHLIANDGPWNHSKQQPLFLNILVAIIVKLLQAYFFALL